MPDWSSNQYTKFEKERTQPSVDLISRIDIIPKTVIDIGCGPGNSTNRLHERFPDAEILGIDSSDNMLETADERYPNLRFEKCTVPDEIFDLGKFDLVFSNACLHWIPNHRELYGILMSKVADMGVLAVQMPLVQIAPFYRVIDEMVLEDKWKELRGIKNFHNLLPDKTYDVLTSISSDIDMWETTYYHIVPTHRSIIEWYMGSGLRPYLDKLDADKRSEFVDDLLKRIQLCFPVQEDGKVILKMPRLFFTAKKI